MIFGAFPLPVRFPRDSEPSPGDRNLWQMRCHGFPSSIRSRDYTRKWGLAVIKTFETLTGISSVRLRESNKSKRNHARMLPCLKRGFENLFFVFWIYFLKEITKVWRDFSKKFLQQLSLRIDAPPRVDMQRNKRQAIPADRLFRQSVDW